MEINLVSKSLKNYLLNKFDAKSIEDIDLNQIQEISLNAIEENGSLADYDFKDFEKLKKLKYVSLQNFTINNYETNEINRCKNIEAIQFSNCIIKSKSRLQNNLRIISFDNCKRVKIYYISLLKKLRILKLSNLRLLNLAKIIYLRNLQKIYFENDIIFNFGKLIHLKELVYIRIIKCKYNKYSERKVSKQIQIEK